jgi:hypothetical protein
MRHLEETLQALHDSEINVTITMLWNGGFEFALCSYMDPHTRTEPLDGMRSPRLGSWPMHCMKPR